MRTDRPTAFLASYRPVSSKSYTGHWGRQSYSRIERKKSYRWAGIQQDSGYLPLASFDVWCIPVDQNKTLLSLTWKSLARSGSSLSLAYLAGRSGVFLGEKNSWPYTKVSINYTDWLLRLFLNIFYADMKLIMDSALQSAQTRPSTHRYCALNWMNFN